MTKTACLALVSLAACLDVPPASPPPRALYKPADVAVYVSTDGSITSTDGSCKGVSWYASSAAFASEMAPGLAARGFRVVEVPDAGTLVVTPLLRLTRCHGAFSDGALSLSVRHGDTVIDSVAPVHGSRWDPETWGRNVADNLAASQAVASVVASTMQVTHAPPTKVTSVLVLPLREKGGVTPATCDLLTGYMLSQLDGVSQFRAVGRDDVEATLGADKQRQALGCDGLACMAEIGGALGVELVMYGDIGAVGDNYAVNVSVVRARDAQVVARSSVLTEKSENALIKEMAPLVSEVVTKLKQRT